MFGAATPRNLPPLPGLIPGYGGGTFNMDGTPASEPQLPAVSAMPQHGLFGRPIPPMVQRQAAPPEAQQPVGNHWSIESFDRMREEMQAAQPSLGSQILGGSMRQPIDYDELAKRLLPEQKKPSTLKKIGMLLVPALMAASGNQAGANQFVGMMANRKREDENYRRDVMLRLADMRYKDYARQNEADLRAANPFTVGRDRVQFNPATGQSEVLYDGPEDFEEYAGTLGLEPGSDEYFQAVEDYVLKGSGPSAHARDVELDDHRTANDVRMEGVRQSNRVGMENLRQRNRGALEGTRQENRMAIRRTPPAPRAGGLLGGKGGGKGDGIPMVRTPEEAMRLPSGTRFRTPDNRIKVVP